MLRAATDEDVESIRRWRNHPEVRRHFIYSAEITSVGHRQWWRRVCADPSSAVLIFEYRGAACGVVTINDHDRASRSAEWGFFLDVAGLQEGGRLFGAWVALERAAIRYALEDLGLRVLGGRTLSTNPAVLELHRRHGFAAVPARGYTTEIDGQEREVVWMELRAAGTVES